jgi:peptidoglycan/xylan/chitin deacetylase (PgdA/CDA1 family)/GT2 family glycosyltransferase
VITTRHLNFHYVAGPSRGRFSVGPDELEAIVRAEMERRAPAVLGDGSDPRATFTVSFDDAHRSVLEHGAPVLARLGVRATLFVPIDWIGSGGEWMEWDELRRWRDQGMAIGAHAVTHPRMAWKLYREDDAAHAARLERECRAAKQRLERELGIACDCFAYPYGEAPAVARAAVRSAGYRAAFTVRDDGAWDGDPLAIPRLDVAALRDAALPTEPTAISVVVPVRDRRDMVHEVVTRLLGGSYPAERFEVIVVDDGSAVDPATLFPAPPPNLRFVRAAERGGPFRAGQARNAGARAARHPVLAFLDSDVVVGEDFLWALDWVHARTPDAVVCGYLSGYNLHERGFVHRLEDVKGAALASVPIIPDRSREPAARACLDNVAWLEEPWRLCYTGNLSLPRALFERSGAFSDRFTGWGLEDIDLGYRLHRAGAAWMFSRFAVGWHLVDPSEGAPRNPFRRDAPVRADFDGYLANVALLCELHPDDPAIAAFAERARADVDEICGRPDTVGIEFGGAALRRAPFHDELHRRAVGGVPTEELLDRVAYATKVGAKRLWLLGGEPAEHEGFSAVLAAARAAKLGSGMLTQGHAFAVAERAQEARAAGLEHATIVFAGHDDATHEALFGAGAALDHAAGVRALRAAGVHVSARVIVTPGDDPRALVARVLALGIAIDEIAFTRAVDPRALAAELGEHAAKLCALAP